jgi:hypothetical protein
MRPVHMALGLEPGVQPHYAAVFLASTDAPIGAAPIGAAHPPESPPSEGIIEHPLIEGRAGATSVNLRITVGGVVVFLAYEGENI